MAPESPPLKWPHPQGRNPSAKTLKGKRAPKKIPRRENSHLENTPNLKEGEKKKTGIKKNKGSGNKGPP